MDQERFEIGKEARGRVLGQEYVDRAFNTADSFNLEFQQLVTEYCWGEVWGRSVLSDKQRSLHNLCIIATLNRSVGLGPLAQIVVALGIAVGSGVLAYQLLR